MPVPKSHGDEVFAGTVNGSGVLHLVVTRDPSQTVVARIVELVAEASATKARTQLFIEKIEQRYSVGVVVATVALIAVPLLLGAALQAWEAISSRSAVRTPTGACRRRNWRRPSRPAPPPPSSW